MVLVGASMSGIICHGSAGYSFQTQRPRSSGGVRGISCGD